MKNAIAYVRVYTEGQEDKFGIEAQRNAIQKYADENGYEILKWVEEVGSGAKERPLLEEIIYGVTNPPFDALIVYKNDRVARDTKLYFTYLYFLERRNVKLISTQEEFEDEFANVYRALLQFVAEQERKNILMRTLAGRKVKRGNGGYSGGGVPYGYTNINKELELVEEEAEAVRMIHSLHDKGYSLRRIAEEIQALGIDKTWNSIRTIIDNKKLYQGYVKFEGEWIKARHKAILEERE